MKETIKKAAPPFLINWYHYLLAFLAVLAYRFPSQHKQLKVIGVTGTNGKSTTVKMIGRILEEAGFSVAFISSIKFKVKEEEKENDLRMTMPGRFFIQRFLRRALDRGCQYVILEVTSEGIKQHRHRFIDFNVAVFTNLAPEHIESHGSFEAYRRAKEKLFQITHDIHVVNLDDENVSYFLKFPAEEKYGYTINGKTKAPGRKGLSIISALSLAAFSHGKGVEFKIQEVSFNLPLMGRFNIYNALAAVGVAQSQGINLKVCKRALGGIKGIPGRMEEVISKPFRVIVDYAFTPQALEKVYQALREDFHPRKMICVLGACGGGRDKWKRTVLGEIAARNCGKVIVTNEDPYNEDPIEIIKQVAEGTGGRGEKVLERREAIKKALQLAEPGDLVIITGKGCESSICVAGGRKVSWDDRKVAREEYEKLGKIS